MAHIVSELTLITDMQSRYEMMDKVPSELFSDTCIGCGLALATRVAISNMQIYTIYS